MPSVELSEQEWSQVMGIVATAPWRDANPLLMKIGAQLQAAQVNRPPPPPNSPDIRFENGKEAHHE